MVTKFTFTGCLRVLLSAVVMLSLCQPNLAQLTEDSAVSNLASGLFVNEDIVKRLLPQSLQLQGPSMTLTRRQHEKKMKQFYELLHSLTFLSEREKQLRTMLTLPDHQNNPELMAVQVVLQKLTDNGCALLKLKVGNQTECTYADLMVLKAKIEALQTVDDKIIPTLFEYRNNEIEGVYKSSWLTMNVVCNLSSAALSTLNGFRPRLYGRTYSQDNC